MEPENYSTASAIIPADQISPAQPSVHDNQQKASIHSHTQLPSAPIDMKDKYLITFDENDPLNPLLWSSRRKFVITAVGAFASFISAYSSSAWSPNVIPMSQIFHVSIEVNVLATSLYVAGYAFGPMVWGPLSEVQGRRIPICVSMFGFVCFSAMDSTAKDLQTIFICRFFEGVMGSCPQSVVAAIIGDLYDERQRDIAIAGWATTLFFGPCTAPFVSGFSIMDQSLGWRYSGYWVTIMGGLSLISCLIFLEETYPPILMSWKARRLRKSTGNWAFYAQQDEMEIDVKEMITKYFTRPLHMLVTEPLLFLVSFYMSFVYALLYLFFTAYPLVFQVVHHMNPGVGGLPLLGLGIGVMFSAAYTITYHSIYHKQLSASQHKAVPEVRLPQVMVGGVCFAVGLFWFGWTGNKPDIHWSIPALAGVLIGFGNTSVFLPLLNYLVDTYLMLAASAISANAMMRSAFAAGFPMFATYMYSGLGIGKATTVLGCVAAALIPVPVFFYFFGEKLRGRSHYAPKMSIQRPSLDEEKTIYGSEGQGGSSENSTIAGDKLRKPVAA